MSEAERAGVARDAVAGPAVTQHEAPELQRLAKALRVFASDRDWEQFHSPKNIAMALAGECGEVLEHFQWLTEAQSTTLPEAVRREVGHELADVFLYTLRMADLLDIDLAAAAHEKMRINNERYPAEQVRGDARRASHWAAAGAEKTSHDPTET